ncbi:MAG: DUF3144 domain-containing protein [Desulfuromonas sp.]|nr:MAG: DUF3144 domain-containing protein [Desulfuromonas sp.]
MTKKNEELELFDIADRFIVIANQIVQKEEQGVGRVGAALRYAAARFSAHEAALGTKDLAADKQKALDWFVDQYAKMLSDNLDQHAKKQ